MIIRPLCADDLHPDLFSDFRHEQHWTRQWISTESGWQLQPVSRSRHWDAEKRRWLPRYLQEQLDRGGQVFGAFSGGRLVGFTAVDGTVISSYAALSMLFVEDDRKRQGIGRALLTQAAAAAKTLGAKKLFIPAIPSRETVAFYFASGCRDAQVIIPDFLDTDEDRCLELPL